MKTISLFTGAGGLDIGAVSVGAKIVSCVENDGDSVKTLRMNEIGRGMEILEEDITQVPTSRLLKASGLKSGQADLVIGGPPCQSFSKNNYWTQSGEESLRRRLRSKEKATSSGKSGKYLASLTLAKPKQRVDVKEDRRSSLVMEFARIIVEVKPKGFVFENVPSLLHPKNQPFLDSFIAEVSRAGYAVSYRVLSSEEFGAPQKRKRLFVTGLKGKRAPSEPIPTHSDDPSSGLKSIVTAGEAIKPYGFKKYFEPEEVMTGRWAKYLPDIPPGMNYKALTRWAGYKNPVFEAETRFWNFLLKLHPDKPSWTIPANPGPWIGPLHWDNRRLRVPEIAAIQGFPHDYKFYGSRRSVVKQIGNAVPSQMARAAIKTVIDGIYGEK